MFLPELCEAFSAKFGITISPSAAGRALTAKGLTLKDGTTRFDAAAGREFLCTANYLMLRAPDVQFYFVDEISVDDQGLWRRSGWTPAKSEFLQPHAVGRSNRSSLMVALGPHGVVWSATTEGTFDGPCSAAAIRSLARTLPPRSVVVLDDTAVHHTEEFETALYPLKALFLPPCSPWLNPAEHVFSYLRRELRLRDVQLPDCHFLRELVHQCPHGEATIRACGYYGI
jgi:hypothetical protein